MLVTHPRNPTIERDALVAVVNALVECSVSCVICADACLGEEDITDDLRRCIRTDLDCSDVCLATSRILLRQTETSLELVRTQTEACAAICAICAKECAHHVHHEHCRLCADVCQRCAEQCNELCELLKSVAK